MHDDPTRTPPDVFADGVSVGSGPYGVTLTFFASEPWRPAGDPGVPGRIMAHVRMSAQLAEALSKSIDGSLATIPPGEIKFDRADE